MADETTSFQSICINTPGTIPSIHTVIYLPTAGKEEQFVTSLVELDTHIADLFDIHPGAAHFIRGDANSNPKNAFKTSFSIKEMAVIYGLGCLHFFSEDIFHFLSEVVFIFLDKVVFI